MTMQTISLSSIAPVKGNPRKSFDARAIEGLAASIKTDGLLQNLVVKPDGKRFAIVSGERRYRALKLLEDRGELPEDFAVNVEVRKSLSKDDTLRISTVENLQRANLAPLEETAALTKLLHKGVTLDDLVAQTGLSSTTIRRRLALNNLCKAAAKSLAAGELTLAQAEALSFGSEGEQEDGLDQILRGEYSADDIREWFLSERPSVALAIFPVEQYTGTITTDLFAEDETSYFDDAEAFFALQREAVEQLAAHHRELAAWVEVTDCQSVPDWQYRKARRNQKGGVLINLSPSGRVEVREGLAKSKVDERTARDTADSPLAPKAARASYPAPLCRHIAHHKTMAVQELLLSDARTAKVIAALTAFAALEPHDAVRALSKEAAPQAAYRVLEAQALLYAKKLGFEIEDGESLWAQFPPRGFDDVMVFHSIKALSDHDLDGLLTLLTALTFGQDDCDRLDVGESLFNAAAADLNVSMRNHWQPDAAFLSRRTHQQLVVIAGECGYADNRGGLSSYKKAELVSGLAKHFECARVAESPAPAQVKAREWLPDAMCFPAIDPDAPPTEDDDATDEPADE